MSKRMRTNPESNLLQFQSKSTFLISLEKTLIEFLLIKRDVFLPQNKKSVADQWDERKKRNLDSAFLSNILL